MIAFTISSLVSVGSMITNSAMNASAQTLERFAADVLAHRGEVEAALALGAAPPQTVLAYVRTAVGASLIPSINSMRSLGIVWIPGLMAGMLLTGTNPLYAAVYQFVVVTLMYAAACWSWRRRMLCAAASSRLRRSCCCGPGPRGS